MDSCARISGFVSILTTANGPQAGQETAKKKFRAVRMQDFRALSRIPAEPDPFGLTEAPVAWGVPRQCGKACRGKPSGLGHEVSLEAALPCVAHFGKWVQCKSPALAAATTLHCKANEKLPDAIFSLPCRQFLGWQRLPHDIDLGFVQIKFGASFVAHLKRMPFSRPLHRLYLNGFARADRRGRQSGCFKDTDDVPKSVSRVAGM